MTVYSKIEYIKNESIAIAERFTPIVISVVITFLILKFKINFMVNDNFKELLDGTITILSIIIGFIGAMIPVIISMKTDSTFVQYLFEKDKDCLFKKYLKRNLTAGILAALLNLGLYVRESFGKYNIYIYYTWIFLVVYFLFLTLRSLKFMIDIIFKEDKTNYNLKKTITKDN